MGTGDVEESVKQRHVGFIPVEKECRFCRYKLRIVFINGTPKYYECWKCQRWGLLNNELRGLVSYLKPKRANEGIAKVPGSTGSIYDVTWKIIDGEKVGVKCTCKGFAFRGKCSHLKKIK